MVLDKRILGDLQRLTKFVHTGALEVYHSLYNKYLPKRQHFGYKAMLARSQLAALDHNSSSKREQAVARTGNKCYRYVFPKGMKDWVVKPAYLKKEKQHIPEMLCAVLETRARGDKPEEIIIPVLPRNIAPIPRSVKALRQRHVSRFGKKV